MPLFLLIVQLPILASDVQSGQQGQIRYTHGRTPRSQLTHLPVDVTGDTSDMCLTVITGNRQTLAHDLDFDAVHVPSRQAQPFQTAQNPLEASPNLGSFLLVRLELRCRRRQLLLLVPQLFRQRLVLLPYAFVLVDELADLVFQKFQAL
jgi:hypothetical protein